MAWTIRGSRKHTRRLSRSREDGTLSSAPFSVANLARGQPSLVLTACFHRFLLKYASRDEVELLGRGNGGIVEIRNNIAEYEEKSPLYGFLRYRRRNVIIKYLPEGCSRLIQGIILPLPLPLRCSSRKWLIRSPTARVTVHFDAVCDRFSPYDTVFEITESKELKDTKLSAACSLHAASGSSSSSSSSLRRRRLVEIAEEEEEEERERKRQSVVKEEERQNSAAPPTSEPPVTLNADLANSPEASRFANQLDPPAFTGVPRPSSPAKSFDEIPGRLSSQSSRYDLYPTSSYPYLKPRVKLGPRPSAEGGRPRSSAGGAAHRPVSTVPAGLKSLSSKGSRKGRSQEPDGERPESPIKEEAENPILQQPPSGPDSKQSEEEPARPRTNSGAPAPVATESPLKINMPAIAPPPTKQNTLTPEKARLLKAMKLREKKMMSLQPMLDLPAVDVPLEPGSPGLPDENAPSAEDQSVESDAQHENPPADSKADCGIEVEAGTDHASVDTRTDSHPASPLAASDIGDSTQASSLSESTDETVLAKDQDPAEGEQVDDGTQPPSASQHGTSPIHDSVEDTTSPPDHEQPEEPATAHHETVEENEQSHTEVQNVVEQEPASQKTASGNAVSESSAVSENESSDTTAVVAADTPEAPSADPLGEEASSTPPIRIPLSKFSTQETKSPTPATTGAIAPIAAQTADADAWSLTEVAPPVPEKDDSPLTGGVPAEITTEASKSSRRKVPEPIRTNIDAPEKDKRRSVISMLENDGFIEELQSATVQQATPITVSKSPVNSLFSADASSKKAPGGSDRPGFPRTVSNPVRSSFLAPGEAPAGPARSVSSGAAYLNRLSQQSAAADLRPKSAKLGSSISQRIKALEKLSGSNGPGETATPKERPSSTFFAVRKASTREPSRSPSVVDRASSLTRGPTPTPPESMESSPETTRSVRRDRSGSLVNRMSMFEGGMPPRGRPESIQVKARIIRDPNQPFPKVPEPKADVADYGPLDLKQSPLVVDIQSPARPLSALSARLAEQELAAQAKQSLLERRLSKETRSQPHDPGKEAANDEVKHGAEGPRPRRRSSLSVVKDFIKDRGGSLMGAKSPSTDNLGLSQSPAPTSLASPAIPTPSRSPSRPPSVHQAVSLTRRLSISSRRSSIEQASPALSASGAAVLSPSRAVDAGTETETEVRNTDKNSGPSSPNQSKAGRASRFMRRLSNTLTSGRKNTTPSSPPTVTEENAAEVEAASRASTAQSQPSIVAFMGDVNVQFPDNLLWKRRSICLDSQGFLILSAVQGTAMLPIATGKDRQQAAGHVKRYHMSDFKAPYAPDVELQELPNSVVLDLVDGSGLQIACEDRAGQMSILHSKSNSG